MPPLSAVDKARLLASGDVEISLVMPVVVRGAELVIAAVVTQEAAGGDTTRAIAHTTHLCTPEADGQPVVFTVPRAPESREFNPHVGIEARASATYSCWSSLDGAGRELAGQDWTWELGEWG